MSHHGFELFILLGHNGSVAARLKFSVAKFDFQMMRCSHAILPAMR